MKDIIILNGPPGSGKDAICNRLHLLLGTNKIRHLEVKHRLFELCLAISGLDENTWWSLYNDRALKETPNSWLAGKTPRQFMIHVSENVMKPLYGDNYFGKYAAQQASEAEQPLLVFSDGGFPTEVEALSSVGYIHLVHLYRAGCSFAGDSRSYIDPNLKCLSTFLEVHQVEGRLGLAVSTIFNHILDWRSK